MKINCSVIRSVHSGYLKISLNIFVADCYEVEWKAQIFWNESQIKLKGQETDFKQIVTEKNEKKEIKSIPSAFVIHYCKKLSRVKNPRKIKLN